MLLFFLFYLVGMVLLYFWLKNQSLVNTVEEVLFTVVLSGGIGLVFSFAASKANIGHWLVWVCFVGLGALISYKLFEKKK